MFSGIRSPLFHPLPGVGLGHNLAYNYNRTKECNFVEKKTAWKSDEWFSS